MRRPSMNQTCPLNPSDNSKQGRFGFLAIVGSRDSLRQHFPASASAVVAISKFLILDSIKLAGSPEQFLSQELSR